jgi:hypothetical protein
MKKKIKSDIILSSMMVELPLTTDTHMVVINHSTAALLRRRLQMMNLTESNGVTKENKKDD